MMTTQKLRHIIIIMLTLYTQFANANITFKVYLMDDDGGIIGYTTLQDQLFAKLYNKKLIVSKNILNRKIAYLKIQDLPLLHTNMDNKFDFYRIKDWVENILNNRLLKDMPAIIKIRNEIRKMQEIEKIEYSNTKVDMMTCLNQIHCSEWVPNNIYNALLGSPNLIQTHYIKPRMSIDGFLSLMDRGTLEESSSLLQALESNWSSSFYYRMRRDKQLIGLRRQKQNKEKFITNTDSGIHVYLEGDQSHLSFLEKMPIDTYKSLTRIPESNSAITIRGGVPYIKINSLFNLAPRMDSISEVLWMTQFANSAIENYKRIKKPYDRKFFKTSLRLFLNEAFPITGIRPTTLTDNIVLTIQNFYIE